METSTKSKAKDDNNNENQQQQSTNPSDENDDEEFDAKNIFDDNGKLDIGMLTGMLTTSSTSPPIVNRVLSLRLSNINFDDAKMANGVSRFPLLQKLHISGTSITGATLDKLPASLKFLILEACDVTDENIAKLQHLTNLTTLVLQQCFAISGSTFDKLPPNLTWLEIEECPDVGDDAISKLSHLTKLRTFFIGDCEQITGSTFNKIPESVEELLLVDCDQLTNMNLRKLARLKNLRELSINQYMINGRTRGHLTNAIKGLKIN